MANRKKEAAGNAPAAATNQAAPATFVPAEAAAQSSSGEAGEATGNDGLAQVIIGQQPGQIASALSAPTLDSGAPEGGVVSEGTGGNPGGDEMLGRTVLVQSRSSRGRWRIGRHFTTEPSAVLVDELTEDELGRLLADPELIVSLDD